MACTEFYLILKLLPMITSSVTGSRDCCMSHQSADTGQWHSERGWEAKRLAHTPHSPNVFAKVKQILHEGGLDVRILPKISQVQHYCRSVTHCLLSVEPSLTLLIDSSIVNQFQPFFDCKCTCTWCPQAAPCWPVCRSLADGFQATSIFILL